jgi:hypothetical protein
MAEGVERRPRLFFNGYPQEMPFINKRAKWFSTGALWLGVAGALFLAGCGDSGSTDESNGGVVATSSKKVFIKRSDHICEKADEKQVQMHDAYLKERPNAEQTPSGQVRTVTKIVLPPMNREVEELNELNLPEEETAEAMAILRELEESQQKAEADPRAIVEGEWPFEAAEKRAKKFGFDACSLPG